ncbi:MBL fold metallo-hydrolase [Sphingomonas sp. TX0543]|nr:MBL fold metallo-hydrolase [Sphingomonas fennica]
MEAPELIFHGAAQTVTGSCMEVAWGKHRILIDCGMFQGSRSLERCNHDPFDFRPEAIDAVILTHAHIDHSGLLPRLAAEGLKAPIFTTSPTMDLIGYMLADSARLQEQDAAHRNNRKDRADEPKVEPLYTMADAEAALALVEPVELGDWFEPAPGFRARLWNAGHILGSASVELEVGGVTTLFSGDLGPTPKTFQLAPDGPSDIDYVVCESTYGDRDREDVTIAERQALLEQEIRDAMSRGGNLVIPVFAVERTQELLFDIASLMNSGRLPERQVFIDSPLATRATSVFAKHDHELAAMGEGEVFRLPAFHYVENSLESMRLNTTSGAIILAASGMCEGGRIRHHLVHNLARQDSTILFVGYQAVGTLGRIIRDGAERVRISGRDIAVRARIRAIDSYSAHADRSDLLAWIGKRTPIKGTLFLDHGEEPAIAALKAASEKLVAVADVRAPALGERYSLVPNGPAKRLSTGDPVRQRCVSRDWQNDYADFTVHLKRNLQRISDEAARRHALEQMRKVLDDYDHFREERRHRAEETPSQRRRR